MRERIDMANPREVIRVLKQRYQAAGRPEKSRILDELVAVSGLHRKHAIRLLARRRPIGGDACSPSARRGQPIAIFPFFQASQPIARPRDATPPHG